MSQLPTGTVTFLFTDIEGSTARWDAQPDAMRAALERHDALMRAAVEAHGGHVFKTVGDAFCAAFATAGAGLAAAIEAQRAVAGEDWTAFGEGFAPIRVRMGLHTGEATERGGDYFGQPVNRVARLEAAGHGGQVLLSAPTYHIVREQLPEGFELVDRGEHRLKDLRHTEHIFQLRGPGLPEVDTPPETAAALHPRDRVRVAEVGAGAESSSGRSDGRSASRRGSAGREPSGADDRAGDGSDRGDGGDGGDGLGGLWKSLEVTLRADAQEAPTLTLTPEEAIELARHKPADWREWRLGRVAEWSQPRYRLDGRFVGLTLLIDQGEESVQGRWKEAEARFDDLGALLEAAPDPAIVVLGPPGGGKSTLLRRLELDTAIAGMRGDGPEVGRGGANVVETSSGDDVRGPATAREASASASDDGGRVTFFIPLSTYKPARPGDPPPDPGEWLASQWRARFPELPALESLLEEGRMTLLLDALNEMPAASEKDFRQRVQLWKAWLQELVAARAGNRVVFSCRSLDYSQPLSTPDLRVPQVRIEPLTDEQVRDFLTVYSPGRWREIWAALSGSPQLEVLRSPYFLALFVEQVEATGELPAGRAALFTGFVRQALRREVERGVELFEPGELLESRDLRRLATWRWQGPYDLPERGKLLPKLAGLAHAMQTSGAGGGGSQVRIDLDEALDLLGDDAGERIVAAGEALAVLDEDEAAGELMYFHQLVQEYFAARELAKAPDPELVRVEWRAAEIRPSVDEVIDGLDAADPLPPLASTGWEETTVLAAAMTEDPAAFMRGVAETNLALAGRVAAQPELAGRVPDEVLDEVRRALVRRSRDPEADLRDRIACGLAVGDLGDPRFERREGPHGEYLLPPMVAIPGELYPIGDDEPIEWHGQVDTDHLPRHTVDISGFSIGRFPVTNAEWRCFIEAGGYEDERWWDTQAGRAWRRGEGTASGIHAGVREFVERCRARPALMDEYLEAGTWDEESYERGRRRVEMSAEELDAHLCELYPGGRHSEPHYWGDARFNRASQPVVGICWYEARAYANWLSACSGTQFRLPTEVEWEAAARGLRGRRYAYGDDFDPLRGNTVETHLRRPAPIGVFPWGDTPEGVCDLGGSVSEWTSSAFGDNQESPDFAYPYERGDGREEAEDTPDRLRVLRGGSWFNTGVHARAAFRNWDFPTARRTGGGFRLVCASPISLISGR